MLTNEQVAANYEAALELATRFFMGQADVQKAARRLADALAEFGVPYAIAGGLAVAARGHVRVTVDVDGTSVLSLPALVELKLASGMNAPDRLQDLADVIALIRANDLPERFGEQLDRYVRGKYRVLWGHAQRRSDDE